jgi:uncharacterized membrane protein SpoIIM required for sporulation
MTMVLEVLVNPNKVTGKSWEMFFIGMIYSAVGLLLGYWVFRSHVSLVMVMFTTMASIPFVRSAIKADVNQPKQGSLWKVHEKTIAMFTFLFIGFVITFLLAFLLLPEETVKETFSAQVGTIADIRGTPTGNFFSTISMFGSILVNNIKVMMFCLIFSLLFGSGAIFILSWNASVMGAAIGGAVRQGISENITGSFHLVSTNLMGYFVHGIPEIMAYFVAGLAGGIISIATMRKHFNGTDFNKSARDALNLMAFAVVILILAGLIEVFISPNLL